MGTIHKIKAALKCARRLFIPDHVTLAKITVLAPNEYLKGRRALITGGTSGIGYAIAKAFLEAGASVVITSRSKEKAERKADELKQYAMNGSQVVGIGLDNNKPSTFEPTLDQLYKDGAIDILVNNAGVQGAQFGSATEEQFDAVMNTNVKGTFFLSQAVARRMIDSGLQGNILNICSSSSLRPAANGYTLSKVAMKELTAGMAKSLVGKGIIVNGLAPGPTATPMLHRDKTGDISATFNPLGRCALPEEIANMAVILSSNLGQTIVGSIVYMTGGAGVLTYEDVKYTF